MAQTYIKQLAFSWLRMVHRKVSRDKQRLISTTNDS